MGWWSISRNGGGGISTEKTEMYNGDGPADILGVAVEKVVKEYEVAWGRKPYKEELEEAVNFVAEGHKLPSAP